MRSLSPNDFSNKALASLVRDWILGGTSFIGDVESMVQGTWSFSLDFVDVGLDVGLRPCTYGEHKTIFFFRDFRRIIIISVS